MLRGWIPYLAANEITNAGEDVSSSPEYVWAINSQTHSQLVAPNKPTDKSYASLFNWQIPSRDADEQMALFFA